MANIVDYLTWRGDLTLRERPFNDVDNLILSTLAYLDFTGIVPGPGKGPVSLSRACDTLLRETGGDVSSRLRSLARLDSKFVVHLARSKRFGRMMMHSCVDVLDEERSLQFAAFQVDVTADETYVSYRGSDSTLVSWREDFMLSFSETEAQRQAVAYLEQALEKAQERGRSLLVGGHSKGGNLAVYAALSCPINLQPLIERVWSNDGPGITAEVLPVSPATLLGERYVRILPTYDMVGILLERQDDPRLVVNSSASGARQHDPLTWQVTPFGMDEAADLAPESKLIQEAIDEWLLEVPMEERSQLVDQLFDALEASGARTLDEVLEGLGSLRATIAAMGDMDESTKQLIRKLAGNVVSKTVEAVTSSLYDAIDSVAAKTLRVVPPQGAEGEDKA